MRSYLITLALCLAVTDGMVALRPVLHTAEIAMLYMFVVFLSALWWGRGPGLLAGVLASIGLNFLFTVPFTLRVTSVREALSLIIFLVIVEETGRLTERLRQKEQVASRQAQEASTLHALIAGINISTSPEEAVNALPVQVVDTLGVEECAIYLQQGSGALRRVAAAAKHPEEVTAGEEGPRVVVGALDTHAPTGAAAFSVPLSVGPNILGFLYVRPVEGTRLSEATARLIRTFSVQAAVLIDRLRLQQEATEAVAARRTDTTLVDDARGLTRPPRD